MFDALAEYAAFSYLGIVLVLVATGSGLPIPEELVVVLAGIAARHGVMTPWGAFVACLVGALLGDSVMYGFGYIFGRRLLERHSWFSHFLKPAREKKIEGMIKKYGFKVFFVARFLVGLRSAVYLTAGILRVPVRLFILFDFMAATVVIGAFFGLAYFFGEVIQRWFERVRNFEMAILLLTLALIGAVLGLFYVKQLRRREKLELAKAERHRRQLTRHARIPSLPRPSLLSAPATAEQPAP